MFDSVGWLSVILTVFANAVIAFIVVRNNPKSASNILLSVLAMVLAAWAVFNFLALSPGSESIRLFWVRLVMFVTTPLGPLIFLLAKTFPNQKLHLSKLQIVFLSIFGLATAVLALSPYMFTNLKNTPDGGFTLSLGMGIGFYAFNLLFFLSWGFVKLVRNYSRSTDLLRKQLGFFVFGVIASFTLMTITNFIAVVVFRSIKLTFIGPPLTLIMVSSIAFAIVRHKLLDIKVLATEALSLVIVVVLLSKLFVINSIGELFVDIFIFLVVSLFTYLLIKSVRKEVEQRQKLEELTQKLKAIDQQKDEFISMAAHELRAPMTAIKGYLSMVIEGDTGDIPEKARSFLTDATAINERLIRLVNNMLNVSRIEEGRMVYQLENANLSEVIRTAEAQFRPEAERKGLKLISNIPAKIRDLVLVDPDRIHEVIANLVSNAIKYTDSGEILMVLSQPTTQVVRFEIKDSGRGISKEEQEKLFRKFYRAESEVGKTIGTGLGLYICKLLIEKFNGTIGLISDVGKGSTFWFELPISKKTEKEKAES